MPTTYVLLRQRPDEPIVFDLWTVVTVDHGPSQAVRVANDDVTGDDDSVFIAVPTRNWSVVNRHIEHPPPIVRVTEVSTEDFLEHVQADRLTVPDPDDDFVLRSDPEEAA